MPRSSETPPSGRALLVTGLRRCDGITRGCPYQATSQHHGKEQQTSIEAPAARHSGAGRNPETTPGTAPPAQTGIPRPKPHQAPHWVPACAGTTVSNECALSGGRAAPTVDHQHRHREPHAAVIPAQAGIQNPRPPLHHPPRQAPPRPTPHQAPHWVPACAGTTESSVVALAEPHRSTTAENSDPPSKPRRPSFRRRPESRTHARRSTTRPDRRPRVRRPIKRCTGYRPAPVRRIERGRAFRGLPAAAPHCEATHPANTCSVSSSASSPRKPPLWCAHSRA